MLRRMGEGVPPELCASAAGFDYAALKEDPEVVQAVAEGQIALFERARDGGVSGAVRAAMRYETATWTPKAEPNLEATLEDLLRE